MNKARIDRGGAPGPTIGPGMRPSAAPVAPAPAAEAGVAPQAGVSTRSSFVPDAASRKALTPGQQLFVQRTLGRWAKAPDDVVDNVRDALKTAWGLPRDMPLRFSFSPTDRDSALQTSPDGEVFARGELGLPGATVPFDLVLFDERGQAAFEPRLFRGVDSTHRTPLSPEDGKHLANIAGMPRPERERFYSASDSFDSWRTAHRSDAEVLFSGYRDDCVIVVAELAPSPSRSTPEVALFTAAAGPDGHYGPLQRSAEPVSKDPISSECRFTLADGSRAWGLPGVGLTAQGAPVRPFPTFLMEEPRR